MMLANTQSNNTCRYQILVKIPQTGKIISFHTIEVHAKKEHRKVLLNHLIVRYEI